MKTLNWQNYELIFFVAVGVDDDEYDDCASEIKGRSSWVNIFSDDDMTIE